MRTVAWHRACVGLLAAVWLGALLLTSLPMPAFATGGAGGGGSTGGNDSTTGTGGNGAPGVVPSGGGGGGGAGTTGGNGGIGSISGSDVGGNGGAGGNHGVVTPLLNNGTALLGGAGENGAAGITSGSGGGGGAGGYGAVVTTGAPANSNSSTLSGGAGGAGGSAGVGPGNGGTGGIGVDFITSGAAFDNTGTTSGGQGGRGGNSPVGASGAAGAGGDAVVGTGTLTVTNSGTITGGSGNSGGNGFTNTGASSGGGKGISSTTLLITNSGNGAITGGQGGGSAGGGANGASGGSAINGTTVTLNNNDNGTFTGGAGGGGNSSNGGGGATAIAATTVTITNAAGASITGGAGGASPEFDGGAGGLAINGNGGTITNSGAIAAGAGGNANTSGGNAGTGGQGGTAIQGSGYTITNNSGATITGGAGGGVAASALGQGGSGGEGITGDNHTITNNGTITGGSGGSSGVDPSFDSGGAGGSAAAGILGSGNTITNTGTIRGGAGGNGGNASIGNGGAGADGADGIRGAGLTIVNSGTISGGSGGSGGAGAGGGTAGASGVFGNAITFTGGSNSLELQSGSLLSGQVVVQAGATASLILGGSGNASFDTSSLGPLGSGIFQGFTALQKTGTSTWTLSGTSGANLPWTISGGLINFAAAGNLGTGTITLSGGGLQWATGNTTDISGQLAAIGTGGATFDTNGNNVTLATALTGVASDGGLTKAGAGTLTLTAANTYTGATTVNGGVLSVNGSLTSATTVNAGATLQGIGSITGNVTVSGTIAPGNSIGTLTINGAYTQNAGSTYQVQVNNAGQSDKIVVVGAATLAGTLAVQAAAGKYQRTITYTILTATGGIGGSYSSLTSTTASLHPSVAISGNNLILTLLNSLAILPGSDTGSFTPNQQSVVNVLNQVNGSATGDLANALNALFNLSPSQVASILDTLGGQSYSGFSSLQIQSAQLFMDSFSLHTGGGVGTGSGASLPGGSTWQALKVDAADACGEACDVEPLWGAWGGGVGAFGTVAGDFNGHGLTYNLGGFVAGLDRKFAPGFRAGVAAGFNAATLYTNGIPGTGTSNTVQVALYGEYLHDAFYLDALGGYGHSDNRMNRPIVIPGLPFRMAQGYTNANTFFGQLEAGYKISVAPSFGEFLTPFARLQASTSTQAGFSETGADSLDLTIAQQTTNSLRTILGAQLGAGIDAPWHEKLDLVFRLGWSHEYADLSRPVTAAFAGAPALSFTTFGAQAPRDGVVLGLGANTQVAEHTSIYLRYDGDLAGANTNHVLNAGVRYVW